MEVEQLSPAGPENFKEVPPLFLQILEDGCQGRPSGSLKYHIK